MEGLRVVVLIMRRDVWQGLLWNPLQMLGEGSESRSSALCREYGPE